MSGREAIGGVSNGASAFYTSQQALQREVKEKLKGAPGAFMLLKCLYGRRENNLFLNYKY